MDTNITALPTTRTEALHLLLDRVLAGSDVVVCADADDGLELLDRAAASLAGQRSRVVRASASPPGGLSLPGLMAQVTGQPDLAFQDDGTIERVFQALTVVDETCDRIVLLIGDAEALQRATLRYLQFICRTEGDLRLVLAGDQGLLELLNADEFAKLRARLTSSPVLALPPAGLEHGSAPHGFAAAAVLPPASHQPAAAAVPSDDAAAAPAADAPAADVADGYEIVPAALEPLEPLPDPFDAAEPPSRTAAPPEPPVLVPAPAEARSAGAPPRVPMLPRSADRSRGRGKRAAWCAAGVGAAAAAVLGVWLSTDAGESGLFRPPADGATPAAPAAALAPAPATAVPSSNGSAPEASPGKEAAVLPLPPPLPPSAPAGETGSRATALLPRPGAALPPALSSAPSAVPIPDPPPLPEITPRTAAPVLEVPPTPTPRSAPELPALPSAISRGASSAVPLPSVPEVPPVPPAPPASLADQISRLTARIAPVVPNTPPVPQPTAEEPSARTADSPRPSPPAQADEPTPGPGSAGSAQSAASPNPPRSGETRPRRQSPALYSGTLPDPPPGYSQDGSRRSVPAQSGAASQEPVGGSRRTWEEPYPRPAPPAYAQPAAPDWRRWDAPSQATSAAPAQPIHRPYIGTFTTDANGVRVFRFAP